MIRYVIVLVLSMFALGAWAQSSPPLHQHNITAPNLIDGAVHPELIPDSVAYRLYFVAVSIGANPTEAERTRQRVRIMSTGVKNTDQQTLISILSGFRAKYDALVDEYNTSAKEAAARNQTTDAHPLVKEIDALVQSTRDMISAQLSSQSAAKLHAFVVSEKKNMKVTGENQ
jgi:hypothetical protein